MSKRIIIIVLFILLCGCSSKTKTTICEKEIDGNTITIYLDSIDGIISEIRTKEVLSFPYVYLKDEKIMASLKEQIDEDYYLEDNHIIYEKTIIPKTEYSLVKTLDELDKEYFYCAC